MYSERNDEKRALRVENERTDSVRTKGVIQADRNFGIGLGSKVYDLPFCPEE